jgi:uncharacterized protein YndB with AHSA1/START domain
MIISCEVEGAAGYAQTMAITVRDIPASPLQVWAVLADGKKYADWVVGADKVREVEGAWPNQGAQFHHTVGVGPLKIRDSTSVVACDPVRCLALEARVRPFGRASVVLELAASPHGTQVTMTEGPVSPILLRAAKRLFDPLIHVRNLEALRRLENVVCEVAK